VHAALSTQMRGRNGTIGVTEGARGPVVDGAGSRALAVRFSGGAQLQRQGFAVLREVKLAR